MSARKASEPKHSTTSPAATATTVDERRAAWPARVADGGRDFAVASAKSLDGDKCEDVVILDVRGVSQICDFLVIGTGTSDRQMRAAAENLETMAKARDEAPYGVSGYDEGAWIVVDYVDVVVHLFSGDLRSYYDLESLWGDGQRVEWDAVQ